MASGRFVSTSIAEDDRLSRLSMAAELIYLKTIPHLDRDGMISGKPGFLWGKVCPLREDLFGLTAAIIEEWVQVGLVVRIATDEGPALFFPGFLKNNTLPHYNRERPSRFPAPPGYIRTESGLIPEGTEPPKKGVKKPNPAPVLPPSNGNHAHIQDELQDNIQDELQEFDLQEQEEEEVKDEVEVEAEEAAPPATSKHDVDVARVWAKWDANMPGTKSQVITDSVNSLLDDYSAAEIEEAITIACKRNRRSLSYIQGILAKGAFSEAPANSNGYGNGKMGALDVYKEHMRKRGIAI